MLEEIAYGARENYMQSVVHMQSEADNRHVSIFVCGDHDYIDLVVTMVISLAWLPWFYTFAQGCQQQRSSSVCRFGSSDFPWGRCDRCHLFQCVAKICSTRKMRGTKGVYRYRSRR